MASEAEQFFIVIRKLHSPSGVQRGSIGFTLKQAGSGRPYRAPDRVRFVDLGIRSSLVPDPDAVRPVSQQEAGLLLALPEGERLKWLEERTALRRAAELTAGSPVTVQHGEQVLSGVVRYVGPKEDRGDLGRGTVFGVELQGGDRGRGNSDGWIGMTKHFTCKSNCGVFVPFSAIWPVGPRSPSPSERDRNLEPPGPEELSPGDRVTYFVENRCRHGMVVDVEEQAGKAMVKISTDVDESGKRGGEVRVPLDAVAKGEVPAEPPRTDLDTAGGPGGALGVNSLVEVTVDAGNLYGIIRWIGTLPGREEASVGLELEEDKGTSDGTFKQERYFSCPKKRALFIKLSSCRPDSRFQTSALRLGGAVPRPEDAAFAPEAAAAPSRRGHQEVVGPVGSEQVEQLLIGRMRGIQGHCNSCYMDAALFSLFTCSPVLDPLLFKVTAPKNALVQNTLLHDIVNPLRSTGFVEGRHIMRLRQQLQTLGCSHSFTFDEKDPEEFLIVIMQQILAVDPLLKLSVGGEMQESYCYQIFPDQNHQLVLPTVQQLLEHSFHTAALKLAEVPSCLILQMPRFGKKFKMFDKILPSLELDITELLSEGPQQCILCGELAREECTDCFKDPLFGPTGFKVFCRDCSAKVHAHPLRRSHKAAPLLVPPEYSVHGDPRRLTRDRLQLFAVLCIETSHYVSFVKHGPGSGDWIFFDSMADRHGESDGYNIPEVKACPEVGTYLDMSPAELANQAPRDMKGEAKRLFCDAYMYLYQSTSMCLYR